MGVRIAEWKDRRASLYCSTTDWCFGPVFENVDEAEAFLAWLWCDPRVIEEDWKLEREVVKFREERANAAR